MVNQRLRGGLSKGGLVAALACLLLPACGASSDRSTSPANVRQKAQTAAAMEIRAHRRELLPGLVCVRLPPTGPLVIAVAEPTIATRTTELLHQLHIPGTVEIKSRHDYYHEIGVLEKYAQAHIPKRFVTIVMVEGNSSQGFICPRGHIELPAKGHVPPGLLAWAKAIVRRFGSDRIDYRYYRGPRAR
jgi:hypothetical protein